MHAAVVEALDACKQACRPGATYGDIFDAHAKALDNAVLGLDSENADALAFLDSLDRVLRNQPSDGAHEIQSTVWKAPWKSNSSTREMVSSCPAERRMMWRKLGRPSRRRGRRDLPAGDFLKDIGHYRANWKLGL